MSQTNAIRFAWQQGLPCKPYRLVSLLSLQPFLYKSVLIRFYLCYPWIYSGRSLLRRDDSGGWALDHGWAFSDFRNYFQPSTIQPYNHSTIKQYNNSTVQPYNNSTPFLSVLSVNLFPADPSFVGMTAGGGHGLWLNIWRLIWSFVYRIRMRPADLKSHQWSAVGGTLAPEEVRGWAGIGSWLCRGCWCLKQTL